MCVNDLLWKKQKLKGHGYNGEKRMSEAEKRIYDNIRSSPVGEIK